MNPRFSYREAAIQGASPVRLVVLLYEQAIEDLRRALAAHGHRDIEVRTNEIKHALLVISHLQSSLDKHRGGKVAVNLDRFYNQMRAGLLEAQSRQSAAALEKYLSQLVQVREAWCEVERIEQVTTKFAVPPSSVPPSADEPHSMAEWKT
jgi:flagellar secretion chaperone FliS